MTTVTEQGKLLHRQFGVFRYSEQLLQHGLSTPSEQIAVILWFVRSVLSVMHPPPTFAEGAACYTWMDGMLAAALTKLANEGGTDEVVRAASLSTEFASEWGIDHDFAELLNFRCGADAYTQAALRLRSRGFHVQWTEIYDLAGPFVLVQLPHAVRSFSPLRGRGREKAWLASVFYRFALQAILSDRTNRRSLELLDRIPSEAASPDVVFEQAEEASTLSAVSAALMKVPPTERRAIDLYFGLAGREQTLAEVGRELGVSEYLARTAVVNGLARLSALLGVRGPLSRDEFDLLHYTFVEGMDLPQAAARMNLSLREARRLGGSVGSRFRKGLRARTVLHTTGREGPEKGKTAMATPGMKIDPRQLKAWLNGLTENPPLRWNSDSGEVEAEIGGSWWRLADLRETVIRENLVSWMEGAKLPVGWLFVPEPLPKRSSPPEDSLPWLHILQPIRLRSWDTARLLWEHSREYSSNSEALFRAEEEPDPVVLIHDTLASLSSAIESRLPLEIENGEHPLFRADRQENGDALGQWVGAPEGPPLNLGRVLVRRAKSRGVLSDKAIEILAAVFLKELFMSDIVTLPGFQRNLESGVGSVFLEVIPRVQEQEFAEPTSAGAQAATL
jgi:RNA polymerase sigma factor (sigma-70 family)